MEITLQELNEIIEQAKNEAEVTMRSKIAKYINQGYTSNGILNLLSEFNLVTGYRHKNQIQIDGFDSDKPIMIINPRDEE